VAGADERAASEYEIVAVGRSGTERRYPWVAQEELRPGSVVRVGGRDWLVYELGEDGARPVARGKLASYRLRMVYPDGRQELGGFRRYRPDGPRLGHAFTTMPEGEPTSWEVTDVRLAFDDAGEPFLDLVAERDFGELEGDLPDHELEHTLGRDDELPEAAQALLAGAGEEGLSVELAALDPGEAPDWEEARRYIEALTLATVEDDLLEQCGVDTKADREATWLDTVRARLRDDLVALRADLEGDHDEIQEWEFRDGRVFASVGSLDDEADPLSGHGWLCRLLDSGALGAAGFTRVRKAEIVLP
jgi:hypothetical protein